MSSLVVYCHQRDVNTVARFAKACFGCQDFRGGAVMENSVVDVSKAAFMLSCS